MHAVFSGFGHEQKSKLPPPRSSRWPTNGDTIECNYEIPIVLGAGMLAAKNLRNSLRTFLLHLDRPGTNSFISAASSTPFETSTSLSTFTSLRGFASAPRPPPARPRAAAAAAAAASRRASDQGLYLVAVVVGMVGLTYASVPLYRMFCQATGFGGTVQEGRSVEEKLRQRETLRNEALEAAAAARELTVTFNADVSDGLPWKFMPTQRSVRIRPGQSTLAFYTAHNRSDRAVTGVSTYNVAPQQAGQYFNKVQCFCFEEQRLRAGEKVDMPVFFYIDPEFATDPKMRGINHLTLSYTFFKVSEDEDDEESEMAEGVSAQGAFAEAEKRPDFASAG